METKIGGEIWGILTLLTIFLIVLRLFIDGNYLGLIISLIVFLSARLIILYDEEKSLLGSGRL